MSAIPRQVLEKRKEIYDFFIETAHLENQSQEEIGLEKLFDEDDKGRRVLFCMPQSMGDIFLCTALFKSIKELYPNYNLYFACRPEYFSVLDGNPYVHKTIPYAEIMSNEIYMTGNGEHEGFVDVLYIPFLQTQRYVDYLSKTKIALELK